ncbi:hypothetical protein DM01DRAFT_1334805 [Hesseltinella vesiculosa]|uniref:Uncharacterized protein n=1 Tax=Hesseltinella vesiculosa TaxID=101127 RepID=A0A1X2GL44_9FUNG|nr:hypothetical protein DM01DRAFT_1334805 [Hesseltinella vesiculosa]
MIFLFAAALLFPALLVWLYFVDLEDLLSRAATPRITPLPVPALLDAPVASTPSPLVTVGEVTGNFAADFALGLCAIIAVVRYELSGKIKNGSVLLVHHINNCAVCLAPCIVSEAYEDLEISALFFWSCDEVHCQLAGLVLLSFSSVQWCCTVLLVVSIALVLICGVSFYLILRAFHYFCQALTTTTTPWQLTIWTLLPLLPPLALK